MRVAAGLAALFLAGCGHAPEASTPPMQVVMIGDSTAAFYPPGRYPQMGWAMFLSCAVDGDVVVHNDARGGRSTRSFQAEGLWKLSSERLRAGDVLLIQFGHNDQSVERTDRYVPARPGFADNLKLFVQTARDRGATPVLITPVARRRFEAGKPVDSHGVYDDVVREVAAETATPLIDLNALSMAHNAALGEEQSKDLYLHFGMSVWRSNPEGLADNTHFSERGARTIARMVATELAALPTPLSGRINPAAPGLDPDVHAGGPSCTAPPQAPVS